MPLTRRLESVFRQRIGQLPGTAQTALLIAAADNTGEVPAVLGAAAGLKLPVGRGEYRPPGLAPGHGRPHWR